MKRKTSSLAAKPSAPTMNPQSMNSTASLTASTKDHRTKAQSIASHASNMKSRTKVSLNWNRSKATNDSWTKPPSRTQTSCSSQSTSLVASSNRPISQVSYSCRNPASSPSQSYKKRTPQFCRIAIVRPSRSPHCPKYRKLRPFWLISSTTRQCPRKHIQLCRIMIRSRLSRSRRLLLGCPNRHGRFRLRITLSRRLMKLSTFNSTIDSIRGWGRGSHTGLWKQTPRRCRRSICSSKPSTIWLNLTTRTHSSWLVSHSQ